MSAFPKVKKDRELDQFERFAVACRCVPNGARAQPEPPEPDIVINHTIAVELTEMHPAPYGERRRRLEGDQLVCIEAAKAQYSRGEGIPVNVWMSWEPFAELKSRRIVATGLCRLVEQHQPTDQIPIEIGNGFSRIVPELPLTWVMIASGRHHEESAWRDGDAHEVGSLTQLDLQTRITHEDRKVGRYRIAYDSRWLVLLTRSDGPSTWGDPTFEVADADFRTRFDRVFVFDDTLQRSYPLRVNAGFSDSSGVSAS